MHGFGFNYFGGMGTFGWVGMIINLVLSIVMIAAVVYFIVWLIRRGSVREQSLSDSGYPGARQPSAREILDTRYARGEITREQYLMMIEDIE